MKLSEILSLLKAGYTKKEIDEIRAEENKPLDDLPEDTSAQLVEAGPASEVQPAPQEGPGNAEILAAIKDLTKVMQSQAIRSDALTPVKTDTAIDILGSIINNKGE